MRFVSQGIHMMSNNQGCRMSHPSQLERVRYFAGKLLTAEEFESDQEYHLARFRRHNRFLHGWGIVTGLRVSTDGKTTIAIEPGLAIDCAGNELVLAEAIQLPLSGLSGKHFVAICYCEQLVSPQPALDGATEFSRIRESVSVELVGVDPTAKHRGMGPGTPGCGQPHALCLATLSRRGSRWSLT